MKITFEENELANYTAKLQTWWRDRFQYIMTNIISTADRMFGYGMPDKDLRFEIEKWSDRYEKEHPQPSWKDYL